MSDTVKIEGEERVVSSAVRNKYRVLSDVETQQMLALKDAGQYMIDLIEAAGASRELSIAKTKAEEAVMWAVRHVTT